METADLICYILEFSIANFVHYSSRAVSLLVIQSNMYTVERFSDERLLSEAFSVFSISNF